MLDPAICVAWITSLCELRYVAYSHGSAGWLGLALLHPVGLGLVRLGPRGSLGQSFLRMVAEAQEGKPHHTSTF